MTVRGVEFDIYTKATEPTAFATFGYVPEVEAVCTMNQYFTVFLIKQVQCLWFAPTYELTLYLHQVASGRVLGTKEFDSLEEAITFGKDLVISFFPEATLMLSRSQDGK